MIDISAMILVGLVLSLLTKDGDLVKVKAKVLCSGLVCEIKVRVDCLRDFSRQMMVLS